MEVQVSASHINWDGEAIGLILVKGGFRSI